MTGAGVYGENSASVECKVILGKNDGVNIVVIYCDIFTAVRKCIFGTGSKSYEYLICIAYIDCSGCAAVYAGIVKHKLDFGIFVRIYNYNSVI